MTSVLGGFRIHKHVIHYNIGLFCIFVGFYLKPPHEPHGRAFCMFSNILPLNANFDVAVVRAGAGAMERRAGAAGAGGGTTGAPTEANPNLVCLVGARAG
jgi:hypothetical protein